MANNMNRRPCTNMARAPMTDNLRSTGRLSMPEPAPMPAPNDVSCKELMRAIMEADFTALDLQLYLDTHPDDTRALELFREAVRQSKACKAAFEDTFYPLTADSAGRNGTWDWLDGTFPPLS